MKTIDIINEAGSFRVSVKQTYNGKHICFTTHFGESAWCWASPTAAHPRAWAWRWGSGPVTRESCKAKAANRCLDWCANLPE